MKIEFWSPENMLEFWSYVGMLLEGVSPGVLIVVACAAVGLLLGIVVKSWAKASKEDDSSDDDIEYRNY